MARLRDPQNRQKEEGVLEYQEMGEIIEPLPNEWLVSYAKPIIELKFHPNKRYRIICDLISISGADGNQILATSGNELVRFQNQTVTLRRDSLREVLGSTETDDLGSSIFT